MALFYRTHDWVIKDHAKLQKTVKWNVSSKKTTTTRRIIFPMKWFLWNSFLLLLWSGKCLWIFPTKFLVYSKHWELEHINAYPPFIYTLLPHKLALEHVRRLYEKCTIRLSFSPRCSVVAGRALRDHIRHWNSGVRRTKNFLCGEYEAWYIIKSKIHGKNRILRSNFRNIFR